jgi:hypothetical protein
VHSSIILKLKKCILKKKKNNIMISEQTTFTSRLAKEDLLGSEFAQEMQKHYKNKTEYGTTPKKIIMI